MRLRWTDRKETRQTMRMRVWGSPDFLPVISSTTSSKYLNFVRGGLITERRDTERDRERERGREVVCTCMCMCVR